MTAENSQTVGKSFLSSNRRKVMHGIGALTVGSVLIGSASASTGNTNEREETNNKNEQLPIGIQFWTLRGLEESVSDTIDRVADAEYDGTELFTLGDEEPNEIANTLDETGIDAASAHVGLEELEEDFENTVETWTEAGFNTFVVPATDAEFWQSKEGVDEIAERMSTVANRLKDRGIKFAYHNHDWEYFHVMTRWHMSIGQNRRTTMFTFRSMLAGLSPVVPIRLLYPSGTPIGSTLSM